MAIAILERLDFIAQLAAPGKIALSDASRFISYVELVPQIKAVANYLTALNTRVVALRADNSVDWVVLDLACQAAEIVCIPIPLFFCPQQQLHCMQAAGADILMCDSPFDFDEIESQPLAASPLLPRFSGYRLKLAGQAMPQATQKISFTSGSTGAPKGVCLSTAHQWQVAEALADTLMLRDSEHLCILPLATLLENIAGVYTPLLSGSRVYLPDAESRGLSGSSGFDARAYRDCLSQFKPHSLILIPQMLVALVAACEQGWRPPSSLRFAAVGGAKVAPELLVRAQAFGIPVYEGYGLSECASVVALNSPQHWQRGSVGKVLPHCEVSIVDSEIVVRASCHLGYLQEPSSWYPDSIATGDAGSGDSDGFLQVDGRIKNTLITSFGRNINPEWPESLVLANPQMRQCVLLGDGLTALGALVTAAEAWTDADVQRYLDSVNQQLPDYARIATFVRIPIAAWRGLLTENGRPIRLRIAAAYGPEIEQGINASCATARMAKG